MTPDGKVAVARMLDNNVATDNYGDDDGEGGEASKVREEEEGEEAGEEEQRYKLGRFMDVLRSYANRLACITEDKLYDDDDDDDEDDWDAVSGGEHHHQPLLLPI
jgi:hypothetical protein